MLNESNSWEEKPSEACETSIYQLEVNELIAMLGPDYVDPRGRYAGTVVPDSLSHDIAYTPWPGEEDAAEDDDGYLTSKRDLFELACEGLLEHFNRSRISLTSAKELQVLVEDIEDWSQYIQIDKCLLRSNSQRAIITLQNEDHRRVFISSDNGWSFTSESFEYLKPVPSEETKQDSHSAGTLVQATPTEDSPVYQATEPMNSLEKRIEAFLNQELELLFRIGFTIRDLMEGFDSLSEAVSIQNHLILYVTRFEKKPETYIKSSDFESFRQFAKWVYIGAALPDPLRLNWFVHCRRSVVVTTLEELGFNFNQVIEAMWNKHCSGVRL